MSRLCSLSLLRQPGLLNRNEILCNRGHMQLGINTTLLRQVAKQPHGQSRICIHTTPISQTEGDFAVVQKRGVGDSVRTFFDKYFGLTFTENYRRKDLNDAGHVLLNSIYMKADYASLQKFANLEDSFETWLKIIYIHVWMLLVRLKQEGRDGKVMSKVIVHLLWEDITARAGKIQEEVQQHLEIRKQMREYQDLLRTSFMFYDEGLLKNDATLAGSLWNQVYDCGNVDPRWLECLVHYIRFTMARLDALQMNRLVLDAENMEWPLPDKFGAYSQYFSKLDQNVVSA